MFYLYRVSIMSLSG